MKKENSVKAKQIVAALAISAAMSLSVVAQERSGYISSTGRSGYLVSTGRTDTATTADTTVENTDGNGTMGSGNLTVSDDAGAFVSVWSLLGEIL